MEYLFNVENPDASEIHEVLGFVDSDFTSIQLLPYLRKSTKNIIKYISQENYDKAVELFQDDDMDDEFLILVRYAIALGAFREYAPLLDVSFTTSGRVFRADDHAKAAFEWMLDRSDLAMERSYYASLDELLNFLLENSDDFTLPSVFQKITDLYVSSLEVFEEYVKIDSSYALFFNLIPSLRLAEKRIIKSRVGQIDIKQNVEILELVQHICVNYAMMDGLRKNSVQLFPRSVLKESTGLGKHKNATVFDIEATILHYDENNMKLIQELEQEVRKLLPKVDNVKLINFSPKDGFVSL